MSVCPSTAYLMSTIEAIMTKISKNIYGYNVSDKFENPLGQPLLSELLHLLFQGVGGGASGRAGPGRAMTVTFGARASLIE